MIVLRTNHFRRLVQPDSSTFFGQFRLVALNFILFLAHLQFLYSISVIGIPSKVDQFGDNFVVVFFSFVPSPFFPVMYSGNDPLVGSFQGRPPVELGMGDLLLCLIYLLGFKKGDCNIDFCDFEMKCIFLWRGNLYK